MKIHRDVTAMLEFYNQTYPKARKEYKCEMCGETIHAGEVYSCETGKYEGDMFTRSLHEDCFAVLEMAMWDKGEPEFSWDGIRDWWRYHKCDHCKNRIKPCIPEECAFNPDSCGCKTELNNCSDELCDRLDKVCWCTKFEQARQDG
jgi:hypothetical protein